MMPSPSRSKAWLTSWVSRMPSPSKSNPCCWTTISGIPSPSRSTSTGSLFCSCPPAWDISPSSGSFGRSSRSNRSMKLSNISANMIMLLSALISGFIPLIASWERAVSAWAGRSAHHFFPRFTVFPPCAATGPQFRPVPTGFCNFISSSIPNLFLSDNRKMDAPYRISKFHRAAYAKSPGANRAGGFQPYEVELSYTWLRKRRKASLPSGVRA